jgi:tRNA-binding protein
MEHNTLDHFAHTHIYVGTIVSCKIFPEARKPAYQLKIDFGPSIGMKMSSAQITANYTPEQLTGTQILALVNIPTRQIAHFVSEVLVLGVTDTNGNITLIRPESGVTNGEKVH